MILAISVIAIIYSSLCLVLFVFQKSLLYFPTGHTDSPVGHKYVFEVNNHKINAVLLNPGQEQAVIYFGGNAEQIEHTVADFKNYPHHSFYFVNYRGYGGSSGQPHKQGILSDAELIFDQVDQEHTEVILIGRSLGSGVANYLASKRTTPHVILITPYDSIEKVAAGRFSMFPVGLLLTQNFNALAYVKQATTQYTVIYSQRDQVIPYQRTENLIKHMKSQPHVINIPQASHNDISNYPKFWEGVDRVLGM